jgi:acetyl esterase/lipase
MIDRIRNRNEFHPDLRFASMVLPRRVVSRRTLPVMRKLSTLLPENNGVEVHDLGTGARLRVFRRPGPSASPSAALLWIHGGGYVIGTAAQDDRLCRAFAENADVTVVSVDYRLAPDSPYPAALDDCDAALQWLLSQSDVDPTKVVIGGASAGGGLAAALALRVADGGAISPVLQLLAYPMLDDRSDKVSELHRLWDARSNPFGWQSYLGGADPAAAVPARRDDLSGVAPAWIGVGTLDLFFDEDKRYAENLQKAGVPCEFVTVPGAFHGFDLAVRKAEVTKTFFAAQCEALRTAFAA